MSNKNEYKNPLILGRSDLCRTSKNKPLSEISVSDFKTYEDGFVGYRRLHQSDLVVFIDEDGVSRVMKNRYGPSEKTPNNEIEINIVGQVGTGKTTFAALLEDYFLMLGFENTEVVKIDEAFQEDFDRKMVMDRLLVLRNKIKKITIRTTNATRKMSFVGSS